MSLPEFRSTQKGKSRTGNSSKSRSLCGNLWLGLLLLSHEVTISAVIPASCPSPHRCRTCHSQVHPQHACLKGCPPHNEIPGLAYSRASPSQMSAPHLAGVSNHFPFATPLSPDVRVPWAWCPREADCLIQILGAPGPGLLAALQE